MGNTVDNQKERYFYLDVLRVLASYSVVVIHAFGTANELQGSCDWWIWLCFNCLSRWAVPVFTMISGALFLSREIPVRQLFGKYIFKLCLTYIIWALFYAVVTDSNASVAGIVADVIHGHFHLWYLYMVIGLYAMTPIIRQIAKSNEVALYYILVAFVVAFLLPEIGFVLRIIPSTSVLGEWLLVVVSKTNIAIVGGFSSYYLLGYYLHKNELPIHVRKLLYFTGILSAVFTIAATGYLHFCGNSNSEAFVDSFTVNIMFFSVMVFIAIKNAIYVTDKVGSMCSKLSQYCLGEYLIHVFVLSVVKKEMNAMHFALPNIIGIPLVTSFVFLISILITISLKKIPFISRFIA